MYGSGLANSCVARSDLLRAEIYPDSDDTAFDDGDDAVYDRIEFTYNRQGEQKSKKDQNGTIRGFWHDKLGRLEHDYVDTLGQGVDGRVRRITRSYGVGSRPESITSYTMPCPRTGDVVDQVAMVYDAHGLLCAEFQSHSGPVDMLTTPFVQYAYDAALADGELVKGLRPTKLIYPNGRVVRYEYADEASSSSSSGSATPDADDCVNRVKFIADDENGAVGTHLAEYSYLGLGTIVSEDYPEPRVKLDYTFDGFSGFDRFGRIIDQRWQNYATGEDLDRYQYGHDRAGSRTFRRNLTTTERDEHYRYDGLNRLIRADRGNLDAATNRIAGTPERQESWWLDPTGNWTRHTEREAGRVTLDQTREHNRANELVSFSAAVGDPWSNPAHDRNGNMTRIPKPASPSESLTLRWDAWDRLVKVTDSRGLVAEYQYDGRYFRIASHTYRDPAEPDTVLASPLTRQFYHNTRWQALEERTGETPSIPDRQYVWSLRYIDAPILRDRRTLVSTSALSERLYYLVDANFNVTGLVVSTGLLAERYGYRPYGQAVLCAPNWQQHRDGSGFNNGILFTGREKDDATTLHHCRARDFSSTLAAFLTRDVGGRRAYRESLYALLDNSPPNRVDPSGHTPEDVAAKVAGLPIKRACGFNAELLVQAKVWGLPSFGNLGAGGGVYFFPDTCEIGFYSMTSGIVTVIVDKAGIEGAFNFSPVEGGLQAAVSGAGECARFVGPGPADAESFAGVFYTANIGTGGPGVGASGYVGAPSANGRWVGGTIGVGLAIPLPVQGGSTGWKYRLEGVVSLNDNFVTRCLCWKLIEQMPRF